MRHTLLSVTPKTRTFGKRLSVFFFFLDRYPEEGKKLAPASLDPEWKEFIILTLFLVAAFLFFVPRCHLDPFARTSEEVPRKLIREKEEEAEEEKTEVKRVASARLETCHDAGRLIMTVNAEQIGSGGKEEWKSAGGEETDGRAGSMPTIPRHDNAGKSPPTSPLPFTLVAVRGYAPRGKHQRFWKMGFPQDLDRFFFWGGRGFCICNLVLRYKTATSATRKLYGEECVTTLQQEAAWSETDVMDARSGPRIDLRLCRVSEVEY